MQRDVTPVILAGGEGRRLRPLTARARPKPFLKPFSDYSLLQITGLRAAAFNKPVVICHESFSTQALADMSKLGLTPQAVIGEPVMRSTAPAIALAAFTLAERDDLMLVMPSDHYIADHQIFEDTVRRAAATISEDQFALIAATPRGPSSRYGYIQTARAVTENVLKLVRFVEKPDRRTAQTLMENPGMYWNTGIFLCRARFYLKILETAAPDIFRAVRWAHVQSCVSEGGVLCPDRAAYAESPAISVDYAVMEHIKDGVVLPLRTEWYDIGCWQALIEVKLKSVSRSRFQAA